MIEVAHLCKDYLFKRKEAGIDDIIKIAYGE